MESEEIGNAPTQCPVCDGDLLVTRLECSACRTEVNGTFTLSRLATLREPHASLLEMFLRVRGNVKEIERELGLSYPTVRARVEEALEAAGFSKPASRSAEAAGESAEASWEARFEADLADRIRARVEERLSHLTRPGREAEREGSLAEERSRILDLLDRGEIAAEEAAALLRDLKTRR